MNESVSSVFLIKIGYYVVILFTSRKSVRMMEKSCQKAAVMKTDPGRKEVERPAIPNLNLTRKETQSPKTRGREGTICSTITALSRIILFYCNRPTNLYHLLEGGGG